MILKGLEDSNCYKRTFKCEIKNKNTIKMLKNDLIKHYYGTLFKCF